MSGWARAALALSSLALVDLACGGRSTREVGRDPLRRDAGAESRGGASAGGPNEPRDAAPNPPDAEPPDAEPEPPDADSPILEAPVLSAAGSTDYGWTCGLSVYGRATCWGGTHFIPEFVGEYQMPPPGRYLDIWVTPTHGCAIEAETLAIRCFGYEPVIAPPSGAFRRFSRSGQFGAAFCALRDDRAAVCFGGAEELVRQGPYDAYARGNLECGIGTNRRLRCWRTLTSELVMLPFPPAAWTDVAVGEREFCALSESREAHCGDPSTLIATEVHSEVRQLSLGFTGSCAVHTDGSLGCWTTSAVAADIPPTGSFDAVAVGFYFACAARADGTVVCWGRNDYGQGSPPSGLSLR